jgi:hypothetical protein
MQQRSIGRSAAKAYALILLLVAASPHASAQVLYAVDGGGTATLSNLYTINPNSGAVTSTIGTVMLAGNPVPISGLTFDPTNGTLFGTTNSGVSTQLFTINPITARATSTGTVGFSMQGLAFAPNGVLYGYSKGGITGNPSFPKESLYTITKTTGVAALVGPSGFANTQGDGMAINSLGTIFFSGNQSSGQLSNLNSSSGTASTFANLTGGPATTAPIKGLSFDSTGRLFGIYNGNTTDLLEISTTPVSGNVPITDHGTISPPTSSVLTALAFQPVPEPGSMVFLGTAALSLGWFARRRGESRGKSDIARPPAAG